MPNETAADLLRHCRESELTIPEVVRRNETTWRSADEISSGLRTIWRTMRECIFRGCRTDGILPGSLGVLRRAAKMSGTLLGGRRFDSREDWEAAIRTTVCGFRDTLKWVSCFALAVN